MGNCCVKVNTRTDVYSTKKKRKSIVKGPGDPMILGMGAMDHLDDEFQQEKSKHMKSSIVQSHLNSIRESQKSRQSRVTNNYIEMVDEVIVPIYTSQSESNKKPIELDDLTSRNSSTVEVPRLNPKDQEQYHQQESSVRQQSARRSLSVDQKQSVKPHEDLEFDNNTSQNESINQKQIQINSVDIDVDNSQLAFDTYQTQDFINQDSQEILNQSAATQNLTHLNITTQIRDTYTAQHQLENDTSLMMNQSSVSFSNLLLALDKKLLHKSRLTTISRRSNKFNKQQRFESMMMKRELMTNNLANFDQCDSQTRESILKNMKQDLMKSIVEQVEISQRGGSVFQRSNSMEKIKDSQFIIEQEEERKKCMDDDLVEEVDESEEEELADDFLSQLDEIDLDVNQRTSADLINFEEIGALININNFASQLSKQQTKKSPSTKQLLPTISSKNKLQRKHTIDENTNSQPKLTKHSSQTNLNQMQTLQQPQRFLYKAAEDGDQIDEMLENFARLYNVRVPFTRIDKSKYLFGTRLINAYIINGVLMVRVGGGFMTMEEFCEKHSAKETLQIRLRMAKEKKKMPKLIQEVVEKYKIKRFN
eukprot:403341221